MKRNWTEICKIEDQNTRLAISLTRDHDILVKYAKGFPECFTESNDEGPLKVPLSALMKASEEASALEYPDKVEEDRHFWLSSHGRKDRFGIPSSFEFSEEVPEQITKQLKGQRAQAGMTVLWCDKRHMVLNINFKDALPTIGEIMTEIPKLDNLVLVDAEFVDLNA